MDSYDSPALVINFSVSVFESFTKQTIGLASLYRKFKKCFGKFFATLQIWSLHVGFGAEHTESDYVPWMIMG